MGVFISFLILLCNLAIIGAVYWGITKIIGAVPDSWGSGVPAIKHVLVVIVQVIAVIIAVVYIANWVIVVLAGGAGWGIPPIIPYHRH